MATANLDIASVCPQGRECERCTGRLQETLLRSAGIVDVQVDMAASHVSITYDPAILADEEVEHQAQLAGLEVARRIRCEILGITGLDCADCATSLQRALYKLDGVVWSTVNFAASQLRIEYQPDKIAHDDILALVRTFGYDVDEQTAAGPRTSVFRLSGLDCPDCARLLEQRIASLNGVASAQINFAAARLTVMYNPSVVGTDQIARTASEVGYAAQFESTTSAQVPLARSRFVTREVLTALSGGALIATVAAGLLGHSGYPIVAGYALSALLGGFFIARRGYHSIRSLSLDMNVLMTVAAIGAAAIGDWAECAVIVFLFSVANSLEARTMDRTRGAIRSLMNLAPREALVRRNGHDTLVPIEEIAVGDTLLARPGERIAMDGVVQQGQSAVNQAPITGESMPVSKRPGSTVYAGTINGSGALEITVTKLFEDNSISQIVHLVEEAQAQRATSHQFVDRFAQYYTPAVFVAAVLVGLVPIVLGGTPSQWIYRSLSLLVLACPCALVISTPVSIVSAIGNAARRGILVKGGSYIEALSGIDVVAFDKTGTLTMGCPSVTDVLPASGCTSEEVLAIAAGLEMKSEHPLAQAIVDRAHQDGLTPAVAYDFASLAGQGAQAHIGGEVYYIGNQRLFRGLMDIDTCGLMPAITELEAQAKTVVLLGTREELLGTIAIADQIRPGAAEAVAHLREAGVKRVILLTGDNSTTAAAIATAVGVDEYRSELMPEDKVTHIRKLIHDYGRVVMVGDGINDAPALAAATVGIAMGTAGADSALETADIALMGDELGNLPGALRLGRRTVRTVAANIAFALGVKLVFLGLAVPGLLTLWLAVAGDVGTSLIVILNGMRLLRPTRNERR